MVCVRLWVYYCYLAVDKNEGKRAVFEIVPGNREISIADIGEVVAFGLLLRYNCSIVST